MTVDRATTSLLRGNQSVAFASLRPENRRNPREKVWEVCIRMDEVWKRYGPSFKSFAIRYGGMPYRGEGAGSKKEKLGAPEEIKWLIFFGHFLRKFKTITRLDSANRIQNQRQNDRN